MSSMSYLTLVNMVTYKMPSLLDKEESYNSTEDGKYVTYRAGGKPGKRLIRNPGEPGWSDDAFTRIPVIDFTNIDHPDSDVRKALAMELGDAAENVGFWYAANTPVTRELSNEALTALETFFALPEADKLAVSWLKTPGARGYESFADVAQNEGAGNDATLRESFIMGDDKTDPVQYQDPVPTGMSAQNIWPEAMPEFKQILDRYYAVTKSFAVSVLHLFALTLGLEETALDHLHDFPMCALRALHYPPQKPTEGAAGFLAHADFSSFTMVLQGEKYGSGLQVLNTNGHWIDAPALPNTTFTCNVGDYLQSLSSGRFVSTVHRVVNTSGRERYSLPFFFSPDPAAILQPVVSSREDRDFQEEFPDEPIGKQFVRRLMFARRFHPTAKRLTQLGIPSEEWKYEYITGSLP